MKKKLLLLMVLLILIDQLTKNIVITHIFENDYIFIIKNFVYFTFVKNTGAAWSIFSGNVIFLILSTILALFFIYFSFIRKKELKKYEVFLYALLLGGILGNFIDRIFYGYVIDYIGLIFSEYYFPIFNFADICIVSSSIMIIYETLKGEKNELSSK